MAINQLPNLPDAPALGTPAPIFSSMMFSLYAGIKNLVPALNTVTEQIDQASANVNTKEASTVEASSLAASARDEAVIARNEAIGAVATLPEGIINDAIISPTDTWSSSKVAAEIAAGQPIETITMTKDHEVNLTLPTGDVVTTIFRMGGRDVFITKNGYIAVYDIATKTFGAFTLAKDTVSCIYVKYDEDTLVIIKGASASAILYATVITFTGTTVNVGTKYSFTFPSNSNSLLSCVYKIGNAIIVKPQSSTTTTNSYLLAMTISGSVVAFGTAITITHVAGYSPSLSFSGSTVVLAYSTASGNIKFDCFSLSGVTFTEIGNSTTTSESTVGYGFPPIIVNGYAVVINNTKVSYVNISTGLGASTITILPPASNKTTYNYIYNGSSLLVAMGANYWLHFTVSGGVVTYNTNYQLPTTYIRVSDSKIIFMESPLFTVVDINASGTLSITKKAVKSTGVGTFASAATSILNTSFFNYDFDYGNTLYTLDKDGKFLQKSTRSAAALTYYYDYVNNDVACYLLDRDYQTTPIIYSTDSFWEIVQEQLVGSSLVNFKRFV